MNDSKNPPLSAATLHILLALADEDLHGYGSSRKLVPLQRHSSEAGDQL
jgi:hypothetical protein